MRRNALTALCAASTLTLCGCIMPVGIAYPTVSSTPSVPISDDWANETHAFRVDFVESRRSNNASEWDRCTFEEIDLSSRQQVPSQTAVSVSYWMALYSLPGDGRQFKGSERSFDKWVHVRLYRRGYKTIEIAPASAGKLPDWEPAQTHQESEQAIDRLVGMEHSSFRHLEPGSRSPKHEAFLRFAAAEYQRLAATVAEQNLNQVAMRLRLEDKASRLRGLSMN